MKKSGQTLYEKYRIGEKLAQIANWYRNGAIDKDVAHKLHIGLTTFYKIRNQSLEFRETITENKNIADDQVESSLYKRALGFEYEEITQEVRTNNNGSATPTLIRKTKKIMPGDTTAQIFWLKNRRPEKWRDKQEIKHETNDFMDALLHLGKNTSDEKVD